MKRKQEKRYLAKEWETMHSHLLSFVKEGEQEHLHHFRVQVKKLRALVIIADSSLDKPTLAPNFKPVRKVFKKAGEIRDVFIKLEIAKDHGIDNGDFLTDWNRQLETTGKSFRKKGKRHLRDLKRTHTKLKTGIRAIPDVHINLYYQTQLQQIAAALAENTFDDSLHNCRKQLKILIYNYQLLRPTLDLGFNEIYLEEIQTAIGDWHDNQAAIDLLKNENIDKEILNGLNKKNGKLRKQITTLTKDFYNRATTTTELPLEQID